MKPKTKKIVVTGGAGFIGSNFVRHFLGNPDNEEYKVLNLDKLTYAGNLENTRDFENHERYQFVKGDICDPKLVEDCLKGAEAVINFAAETHVDRSILGSEVFIKTDVLGIYNLLEAAKKRGLKKFIQISTDEVYGDILFGSAKESDPLRPSNPYSASKAAGDLLALSYYRTYGIPVTVIRSSNNFGPYQHPEKLIPLFITNALENNSLPLYGEGKNVRDWLYVKDNCQAIELVFKKGRLGEVYNVGGGNEIANLEVTKLILIFLKKPESLISYIHDRPGHDLRYALDTTKMKNEFGWQPQSGFKQALEETVKWYQKNEAWWQKIRQNNREHQEFYQKQYQGFEKKE